MNPLITLTNVKAYRVSVGETPIDGLFVEDGTWKGMSALIRADGQQLIVHPIEASLSRAFSDLFGQPTNATLVSASPDLLCELVNKQEAFQ